MVELGLDGTPKRYWRGRHEGRKMEPVVILLSPRGLALTGVECIWNVEPNVIQRLSGNKAWQHTRFVS
jgi:hypothetical protein